MAKMERLSSCVEDLRAASTAAEHLKQHKRLLKTLISLERHCRPQGVEESPVKASGNEHQLSFHPLLNALTAYCALQTSHSSGSGASGSISTLTAAGGVSIPMSDGILSMLCDLLVRSFDYSAVAALSDAMATRPTSVPVKTWLVKVIARLPLHDALTLVPDVMAFVVKHIRHGEMLLKHTMLESIIRLLDHDVPRLVYFHADALKIVNKCVQDKDPQVRVLSGTLLRVLASRTVSTFNGSNSGGPNATGNSAGSTSSSTTASLGSSGGPNSTGAPTNGTNATANMGISFDIIMQIASKGMDDVSPEARRVFSVVIGIVLAQFASGTAVVHEPTSHGNEISSAPNSGGIGSDEDDSTDASQPPVEPDSSSATVPAPVAAPTAFSKSKLGFKLPSVQLLGMSRRKAAAVNFSTIASIVLYLKEMIESKFLTVSTVPTQSHGGILASYSIALCSMLERLPPDSIGGTQLREIVDALLAILDYPFGLGDLTRARNSVCFVLRYGLNSTLIERQQTELLGVYLEKLQAESIADASFCNHHKILTLLVEVSHMYQALGESSADSVGQSIELLQRFLSHEKQGVRFQAAVALASLVTALPYQLKTVLTYCVDRLSETTSTLLSNHSQVEDTIGDSLEESLDESSTTGSKSLLYGIQGVASAIAHLLRAIRLRADSDISHSVLDQVLTHAIQLVESQFAENFSDSVWLTCTRAGWTLIGALSAVKDDFWVQSKMSSLMSLWLKASVLQTRESSLEILRMEGQLHALYNFLTCAKDVAGSTDGFYMLSGHILHTFVMALQDQLSHPTKRRGQTARYRLLTWILRCFTLLPSVYKDSFITLVDLVAEFTTGQSLTNLTQSPVAPVDTTFLSHALTNADDVLDVSSVAHLEAGDGPSALYSKELNHILFLLQPENTLTDTEMETQYLDVFYASVCERKEEDVYDYYPCSSLAHTRLVDASVLLFGRLFHLLPEDLQLRCLQHYSNVLGESRSHCDVNVCSLLMAALQEASIPSETEAAPSWSMQVQSMLWEMVMSDNPTVRRGAGEALGRLAELLRDDNRRALIQELEKKLANERLPSVTTSSSASDTSIQLAGTLFAVACIKRRCGTKVTIDTGLMYRFGAEVAYPLRTWMLHSWSIVLDSIALSGTDQTQYVNSSMALLETQILAGFESSKGLNRPKWDVGSKVALSQVINSIVSTLGPDVVDSKDRLNKLHVMWGTLRQDGDIRVEREYLAFLEQVVVYAPTKFRLHDLFYIFHIVSDAADILCPATEDAGDTFDTIGTHVTKSPLLSMSGSARSMLQYRAMACIRSLTERKPSLIHQFRIQCLLFHALHAEYTNLTWKYMPTLHGMADSLSFSSLADKSQSVVDAICSTIWSMLDVDGGYQPTARPCHWALFCRSIAIGATSEMPGSEVDVELMSSPSGATNYNADDAWSDVDEASSLEMPLPPSTHSREVRSPSASAITAQMDVWRETKKAVAKLTTFLPPLCRQARHFALVCVLRVFKLLVDGCKRDAEAHFDMLKARSRFSMRCGEDSSFKPGLSREVSRGKEALTPQDNFICMYLDEFVTLACQATTTSSDASELLMFQSTGLELLNVVVTQFKDARDPEVSSGESYLLEPYRAQISSAVRHAVKEVSGGADNKSAAPFHAELAMEAYDISGRCIQLRIAEDKVAIQRILRMVVSEAYGQAEFAGGEVQRTELVLAHLSCLARLVIDSNGLAQESGPGSESMRPSTLLKAVTSSLSASLDTIISCWLDVTRVCGFIMQGSSDAWPALEQPSIDHVQVLSKSPVLKVVVPNLSKHTGDDLGLVKQLRALYDRFWPEMCLALATLPQCFPDAQLVSLHKDELKLLVSTALLYLSSHSTHRSEESVVDLLESIPLFLSTLVDRTEYGLFEHALHILSTTALQRKGRMQNAALSALMNVLYLPVVHELPTSKSLASMIGKAAICPLEVVRTRMQVVGEKTSHEDENLEEVLTLATRGIIALHQTKVARHYVTLALGVVEPAYHGLAHRTELHEVGVTLTRAAVQTLATFACSEEASTFQVDVQSKIRRSFILLVQWLQEELVRAREHKTVAGVDFALRVIGSYVVQFPESVHEDVASFHATVAQLVGTMLTKLHEDHDAKVAPVVAHIVRGVRGVTQKLVQAGDVMNARRYFGQVGGPVMNIIEHGGVLPTDLSEVDEAEQLLRLLMSQLDDSYSPASVCLVLPKLAHVLEASADKHVHTQLSLLVSRSLLQYAQTQPSAFKEAVGAMQSQSRSMLESALRRALSDGKQKASSLSPGTSATNTPRKIDLSRYQH